MQIIRRMMGQAAKGALGMGCKETRGAVNNKEFISRINEFSCFQYKCFNGLSGRLQEYQFFVKQNPELKEYLLHFWEQYPIEQLFYGDRYSKGKDWDIMSIHFNVSNISEIEQDAIDMLGYLSMDTSLMAESWLFRDGGLTPMSDEDSDAMIAFEQKMKSSGSWILEVVGKYVTLCKVNMLLVVMSSISGEQKPFELLSNHMRANVRTIL